MSIMSDTSTVNTAIQEYFTTLSEQISAASRLKDAVNDLLEKCDEATKAGKESLDEWDVLDQSYICIKLRNAFSEIDTKLQAFKNNLSETCKQKDKREHHSKETQNTSEEVIALVLSIVNELHQYHRTVAERIAPIVEYSAYRERYPSKYEMKECSSVPITWKAVNEVNRSLRYGYGLSKEDLAGILSWMHGEDLSESARKTLNLKVDGLILTYKERLSKLDSCEFDVPVAYQMYPLVLQDVIKDCCSPVESIAATGQALPLLKDDLETLIRREIPRIQVQIGDTVYDIASPGKAFENTKQKMVAVRHLATRSAKTHKIEITREQLDLFSLKVLATACISVANASARTAVLIAFGKANLIQVRPSNSKHDPAHISLSGGTIKIKVPSQWCLTEDNNLLQSLGRDQCPAIATVEAVFKSDLDLKAEIQRRAQSLPVVKILRCSGVSVHKGLDKKDPSSKGLRKRLSKATSKLFNRKSVHGIPQKDAGRQEESSPEVKKGNVGGIDNLGASVIDPDTDETREKDPNTDGGSPVPPPRPRRRARTKKKTEGASNQIRLMEEAKHDPKWFSSCKKLEEPALLQAEDNTSLSVASFEELKDVIDLLSGSSTSSLSLNHPFENEKALFQKADNKKQEELKKEIELKGKVSPSDSGIGSTMSVQSHPSVTSISKLHDSDSTGRKISGTNIVAISEKDVTEDEQKLATELANCEKLRENIISCSEQDSHIEDAEVEMLNDNANVDVDGEESEARDDDQTPSNGKNMDFVRITSAYSDERLSTGEVDLKTDDDVAGGVEKEPDYVETSDETSQEKSIKAEEIADKSEGSTGLLNTEGTADQSSYDADGSEDSFEDNLVAKSLSRSTLHDSNESLYYSTWTLDDMISKVDGPPKPNTSIPDEPTDSYFVGFSDSEFVDCKEPDVTSYEQSNPRYSWPFGLGDRLAAIWGEKEMQKSQDSGSGSTEIWGSEKAASVDRGSDHQMLFEGPAPYAARDQKNSGVVSPQNWLHQRLLTEDSFPGMSSKPEDNWSGLLSVCDRHKEELRHPEWGISYPQMHQQEQSGHINWSLQQLSISDVSNHPQSQLARGWPSSTDSQQWSRKFPRHLGRNFNRPSSVPDSVNRTCTERSSVAMHHQSVETFERHNVDKFERAAFKLPSSNSQSIPAHFLSPQYQHWSRDVNSEPLLTATTRRSVDEYKAIYMQQQQRQHSRNASRNLPHQFKTQKW